MYILGIDPGTKESGLVLVEAAEDPRSVEGARRIRVVYAEKAAANEGVLDDLRAGEGPGPWRGRWSLCVIEALSPRGQVVGWDTFRSIQWVGRFEEAAWRPSAPALLVHRDQIKRELLGRTNLPGADAHIRQVLLDEIGPKGTKRAPGPTYGVASHAWAALAAVYVAVRVGDVRRPRTPGDPALGLVPRAGRG